jgi:hypothetical protein
MHGTYDGKYVLQIFSGFQRMEAGAFVLRQDTLEPVGSMPNFGGHHDCVVVPSKVEEQVRIRRVAPLAGGRSRPATARMSVSDRVWLARKVRR